MSESLPEATIVNINIPGEYLANTIVSEEYIQQNTQNTQDNVQLNPDINTVYIQNAVPCNNLAIYNNKQYIYYTLSIGFLSLCNMILNLIIFIVDRLYLSIILVPIYAYAAWQTNPEKVNYYSFYNTFLSIFLFPKLLWLIIILKNLSFSWTLLFISLILDILSIIVLSSYFYKISEN